MQFLKITSSKYLGPNDYTLRKCRDGSFSIFKGKTITQWGTGFQSVRSAEIFLDRHDYISASTDKLKISLDDLEAIKEIYNFKELEPGVFTVGSLRLIVPSDFEVSHDVILQSSTSVSSKKQVISSSESLFKILDSFLFTEVSASAVYRGSQLRSFNLDYIFAKSDRRSTSEITKHLIRVKSSNVWAYGVEIKDNKAKVGDVYVQFKGKNGGPDGGTYVYYDVPIVLWRKFISAPSKGHFVWKYLRNNFLYSKLTGDKKGKLKNAINH